MACLVQNVPDQGRHAVVAVILEESRFLVIRRSEFVRAPGLLCFPGGGIEAGEDIATAMHRELMEELTLNVEIGTHLWTSTTRWGTKLEWLACTRCAGPEPIGAPMEVAEILWLTKKELQNRADLLDSIPDFFVALERGVFRIA